MFRLISGTCTAGPTKACDPSTPCTVWSCQPDSGQCAPQWLSGACTPTDNACIVGAGCVQGACQGGAVAPCDDGDPCTIDACAPTTGLCGHSVAPTGAACGKHRVCSFGSCTCALGTFSAAAVADEWLHAAAPTADGGFVAVGQSSGPGGQRGLLLVVGGANGIKVSRRPAGSNGSTLAFAGVQARTTGLAALATLAGSKVAWLALDSLGNAATETTLVQGAQAQALVGVGDDEAAVLATELWGAGKAVRLLRLTAKGAVQWSTAIAPKDQTLVARAQAVCPVGGDLWVSGQDIGFAAPHPITPRLLRVAAATGQVMAEFAQPKIPQHGLALASGWDGAALLVAGETANATGSITGDWLIRRPLSAGGPPGSATVVHAQTGIRSLRGVAVKSGLSLAVGIVQQDDLDAVALGVSAAGAIWSKMWPMKGKQALHAAIPVPGGWVAVGDRQTDGGHQAMWIRLGEDGADACL